jgi:hypothetical protein
MRPSLTETLQSNANRLSELDAQLHQLLQRLDAKAVFCGFAHRLLADMINNPISGDKQTAYVAIELAAWILYPEFGKCQSRDRQLIDESIAILHDYIQRYQFFRLMAVPDKDSNESLSQHMLAYSAIVRGTAYPQQVARRIKCVMTPFEAELERLTGITPSHASEMVRTLGKQLVNNLNGMLQAFRTAEQRGDQIHRNHGKRTKEAQCELNCIMLEMSDLVDGISAGSWLPSKDQILALAPDLSSNDWNAFRQTIGLTPAARAVLKRAENVQDHPVFFPDDDHAVYLHAGQCYDAIFTFFDDILRSTTGVQDRYGKQIADWMEVETASLVTRLFPATSIICNATFPDPDNPGGETEADTVISWGPFLVVMESKGRRIAISAMRGDVQRLKSTIRTNIQDAFYQARRVVRILDRDGKIRFTERGTGRALEIAADHLQRVYPVSVTLQHLGSIPTQLARTQKIGLFKENAFPWSVSIDDLEVITRFAGSPDVFLHYIDRRLAHQNMETTLVADELNLFGQYLDTRLHPSLYELAPELVDATGGRGVCLEGGENKFAPFYMVELTGEPPPDATSVELKVPPRIRDLLNELRNGSDNGARWISFALLALSDKALKFLHSVLTDFHRIPIAPHPIIRKTFSDGDIVINVLVHESLPPNVFMQMVEARTAAENYRAKARASITFGIDRRVVDKPFVVALWYEEGPWKEDPAMEALIEEDKGHPRRYQMLSTAQPPGRNSPCPCGSGKKFKKCCMGRLERVVPVTNS